MVNFFKLSEKHSNEEEEEGEDDDDGGGDGFDNDTDVEGVGKISCVVVSCWEAGWDGSVL